MSLWRSSKICNALNVSREGLKIAAKNRLRTVGINNAKEIGTQATFNNTAESLKTDGGTENDLSKKRLNASTESEFRKGLNAKTAARMKAAFTRIKYATESSLGTAKATGARLKNATLAGINTASERVSGWDAKTKTMVGAGLVAGAIAAVPLAGFAAAGAFSAPVMAAAPSAGGTFSSAAFSSTAAGYVFTAAQYATPEVILEAVKAAGSAFQAVQGTAAYEAILQGVSAAGFDPSWFGFGESGFDPSSWFGESEGMSVGVKFVIGGAAAVTVVVVALPLLGFTSGGVAAGSAAAFAQSCIGNVAAGGAFAALQSAGAAGLSATAAVTIGFVGGTIAVIFF